MSGTVILSIGQKNKARITPGNFINLGTTTEGVFIAYIQNILKVEVTMWPVCCTANSMYAHFFQDGDLILTHITVLLFICYLVFI